MHERVTALASSNRAPPRRRLGVTDMEITRVGLGAWSFGGGEWAFGWGPQDDRDSIAAIRCAVESGLNWIDTAALYGLGHSEEVVRRALQGLPSSRRPYLFTKCGVVWEGGDRKAFPHHIGNAASLRRELEGSLRRLDVECIDLYQMHWPPTDGTPLEDYWDTLQSFKKEGKVRAVGLSNHSVEQLERAERIAHVDCLQPPLSAIRRTCAAELSWCRAYNTGAIVYSPLQSGLLTGAFHAKSLPPEDWRFLNSRFNGDALQRNLALAEALKPVAARHASTVASVAIAWALAWPGVTGAIVGARNPAQVRGWLQAASMELLPADLREIAAAIERTQAGSGPLMPGGAPGFPAQARPSQC